MVDSKIIVPLNTSIHFPDNMMQLFPDSAIIKNFHAVSYMGVPLLNTDGSILGNLPKRFSDG